MATIQVVPDELNDTAPSPRRKSRRLSSRTPNAIENTTATPGGSAKKREGVGRFGFKKRVPVVAVGSLLVFFGLYAYETLRLIGEGEFYMPHI